ncbi:unnamed protein product [Spirodela intermedia]|uniref:Receptor-like serine/threonine-protein kinase n=1 Tax=Spirodela intermedia TaxID=51605 RepID=A0A7I8JA66_SPIIN|nr:unnamed protein product [Spirodela intermedia]CAA6666333.1 unnamed protein product [Spirodela intermedia]
MAGGASSLFFGSLPVHCLLLLLLMAAPSAVAQQGGARNISLGSTMESGGSPANETFLLGVWFDKIPEKTLVWYANGGQPVRGGSRAEIKTDGRLVLYNHAGQLVWDSGDAGQVNVAYAAMLDTGNFVLCSNTSVIGWQSFAYPVDTILPTQEINRGGLLSSRRLPSDYSAGGSSSACRRPARCALTPSTYPPNGPADRLQSDQREARREDGRGIREVVSAGIYTLENYYQRATLDPDGVLRLYLPNLHMPPGYSPIDPADGSKGCRTDYVGRGCNDDGSPAEGSDMFDMEQIADADWPMSDYEQLSPVDEVKCRRSCLEDCFCAVAIYRNGSCWKKRMPLVNLSSPPDTQQPTEGRPSSSSSSSSRLVMWVLLGLCSPRGLKKLLQWQGKREPDARCRGAYNHVRSFSFRELERATGHFQKELGKGSFGVRTHIAVKMLKGLSEEGDNEFQAEVNAIGQIHHRNLVRLLGFCDEGSHRLLIYELMSNGSLADYLFAAAGGERPPWEQRIHIAFGVARGLVYLHDECRAQIIHCDIKPRTCSSTATSAEDRRLRVGEAALRQPDAHPDGDQGDERIRGAGVVQEHVDHIQGGRVQLRRPLAGDPLLQEERSRKGSAADEPILTDLAYDCYRYNQVSQLVPDGEEGLADMKELERLVAVALWCILDEPSLRPSMKKVLLMLEDEAEVPTPPNGAPPAIKLVSRPLRMELK